MTQMRMPERNALLGALTRLWQRGQDWYRGQVERLRSPQQPAAEVSEPEAVAALSDAQPQRRWEAAAALGRSAHRSQEAVAALAIALADPEPFVRWQAAEALAAQEETTAFPVLRVLLADRDPLRRASAAEALGQLGAKASGSELQRAFADPDARVRAAAALGLGACGDPTAIAGLLRGLNDADLGVRCSAAAALGRIGNPVAALALAETLASREAPLLVRRACAAALTRALDPVAQPMLLQALNDPDPQVRGYVARALGRLGSEEAYEPLLAVCQDNSPLIGGTVGDEATRALGLLKQGGRKAPLEVKASTNGQTEGAG